MKNVIIGAGPAGVVCAETIRAHSLQSDIVIINGESESPYSRMAIPYLLAGMIDEADTRCRRDEEHFEKRQIELKSGRVTAIDSSSKKLTLSGDESLNYDQLLIATGSSPQIPQLKVSSLPGVHTCWTLDDARKIIGLVRDGARVVQLGAGFVASIIMKALVSRGVDLTVVTGSSGLMVRSMLCPSASDLLRRWCESRSVKFFSKTPVSAIEEGPVVSLEDGTRIEADLVVIATGVTANVDFTDGSGLKTDRGILVDETMATSAKDIWAAGDVAQGQAFGSGELEVHQIQPTAVEHGRIAGLNMAGLETAYQGSLQMNVLDTLGLVSFSLGQWKNNGEKREMSEIIDTDRFRFLRLAFSEDHIIGANVVGLESGIGMLRGLIQTRSRLGPWKKRLDDDPSRFTEAFVASIQP